jgi:hypothetical protein
MKRIRVCLLSLVAIALLAVPGFGQYIDFFSDDVEAASKKMKDSKYLGNTGNRYDANSIFNPYGRYGSEFSTDSVNNRFGNYGSPFSPNSARNPYAIDTPKLFDSQGNYRGKLSSNPYDPDSISNPYGVYGSPYSLNSVNNPYGVRAPYSPGLTVIAPRVPVLPAPPTSQLFIPSNQSTQDQIRLLMELRRIKQR